MTDAAGAVVWRAEYKPFGEEHQIQATKDNDLRFVGKEKDEETGLLYFGARYMEALIGRFLAPDPVGAVDPRKTAKVSVNEKTGEIMVDQKIKNINVRNIENPQGLNLYAYALNNPYKFLDVLGLFWEYSHSTGELTYVNNESGARTPIGIGYSGRAIGLNNPTMQNVPNVGPIPQGTYDIGDASSTKGPLTLPLNPRQDTNTFGRDGFLIHGDNSQRNQSASRGCIILDRPIRERINSSQDRELRVTP
jgi:RHS repeat-associated protein